VAANAPDSVFASGRAMATLVELARRPHPVGSPEHTRVRELVEARLRELGLEPELQTTTSVLRTGATARAATVRNVLARLPGTASSGAIVLTAHYDAVPLSSGAGDDGTGVVTILETVRALLTGPPLANDVIVLVTDAEELGLLGARAFVAEHPWMQDVAVVLSVEMRGGAGPSIMFETGSENGWIVEALAAGDPRPFANSLSVALYRRLPNDTDFSPFRDAGVQGLNFAAIGRPRIYHQATDVAENVEEATIQHHGVQLLGMVRELGSRDLTVVDAPDRAYFTAPFLGLVTYPPSWALALSAALVLLTGLVYVIARARGNRARHVLAGFLLGLLALALGAGAGWGLFLGVRGYHPEYGSLVSAFHEEGWYVLAIVGIALAVVTTLFGVAGRRLPFSGLALGAVLLPLAGALALEFTVPLAAMNLQWPTAAAVLAVGVLAVARAGRRPGLVRWILALALTLPVLALLVPVIELVWVAMSLALAPVLGALVALALLLLLPALHALEEPNRWWAPVAGLLVAVACTAVGILRAGSAADRPGPSTLVYAADREAGTAVWASGPDGPGLTWATERVGAFGDADSLPAFPLLGVYRTAAAPALTVPSPEIRARAGERLDGRPVLVLTVDAPLEAEALTLELEGGGDAVFVGVNGHAIPEGPPGGPDDLRVTRLVHWGRPEGALTVEVELGAAGLLPTIRVIEQHLRPAELLGEKPFERPPELAPSVPKRSDRAFFVTRLSFDGPGAVEPLRSDSFPPLALDTAGLRLRPDTGRRATPRDSVGGGLRPDTTAVDSIVADTFPVDTLRPYTPGADSLAPDSLAPDTLGRDTLRADTLGRGGVTRSSARVPTPTPPRTRATPPAARRAPRTPARSPRRARAR
jgi:hypothetical protein